MTRAPPADDVARAVRSRRLMRSKEATSSGEIKRPLTPVVPKYKTASISGSDAALIAKICIALLKEKIATHEQFLTLLGSIGYNISLSTLMRWMREIRAGATIRGHLGNRGNHRKLTGRDMELVHGFVHFQNDQFQSVRVKDVQEYVKERFNVQVSTTLARSYLIEGGFTLRTAKPTRTLVEAGVTTLTRIAYDFLEMCSEVKFFPQSRDLLCSVDFTYTSHRTDRTMTFSPAGGGRPHVVVPMTTYTNCIVTCLWADGVNRTPAVLFTYNPKFARDFNYTERRGDLESRLDMVLLEQEIDADRIVHLQPSSNSQNFVAESHRLLSMFFDMYDLAPGSCALSDQGNAFFAGGESTLEKCGFAKHLSYPPAVHMFLSPNDNCVHGIAKQKWRRTCEDFSDDVLSSVQFLRILDEVTEETVKSMFTRNLQLGNVTVDEKLCRETVGNREKTKISGREAALRAFRIDKNLDARGPSTPLPPELADSLDGCYWSAPLTLRCQ